MQGAVSFPINTSPYFDGARWARILSDVWSGSLSSAAELAERAQARLDALLRHARASVPLYQSLYRNLPADTPLAELPRIDKRMLMADLPASLADRSISRQAIEDFLGEPVRIGTPLAGRYSVWTSSGSTGAPGVFLHDGDAVALYDALELLRFRGVDFSPLRLARLGAGERYAMVSAVEGHFAGVATVERLQHCFPLLAPFVRAFSVLQPLPSLVAALNRYQPTLLATYPTVAELLAEEQDAGRLDLALDEIWCGGECLSAASRRQVAQAFECGVREAYGASEFLSIAWPCALGRLHVNSDWVLLEGVDANGAPVPPGQESATVLLTNLANRVQPLVRYDLGDSITVPAQPCACGSPMPAIEVQGRHDDVLQLARANGPSVKLMPLALATVLEDDAHVNDFQLLQTGERQLRLRLGPVEQSAGRQACTVLRHWLRRQGLAEVRLELDSACPQRDAASGKLRRVINLLPKREASASPRS